MLAGPQQQTDSTTGFGGQFQPSIDAIAQAVEPADDDRHTPAAKRLFQRPQSIAGMRRMHHDNPIQINSPPACRRGIERPVLVDDNKRTVCLYNVGGDGEGERSGSAACIFTQPLNQRSPANPPFRQQVVQCRNAGRKQLVPLFPPPACSLKPPQLLRQMLNRLVVIRPVGHELTGCKSISGIRASGKAPNKKYT